MKLLNYLQIIGFGILFLCSVSCRHSVDEKLIIQNVPFNMPEVEQVNITGKSYNIRDFGAKSDGQTNNLNAIQLAIDKCAENGGGKVIIPAGVWLTGPIQLRSNTELHLETGSILQFSDNFDDYPLMFYKYEKRKAVTCRPPIYGVDLENIAITGNGVIDGAGDAWRPIKKFKVTERQWREIINKGGVVDENRNIWYPSEKAFQGSNKTKSADSHMFYTDTSSNLSLYEDVKDFFRPVLIKLENCNKVLLEGVTFQNSPSWNIHPLLCTNITIRGISVRNPWYSQNGDGLDLESCSIGIVENCTFDVGDDAICIKSGKDKEGRDRNVPTEKFIIQNNIVYHGHGGFVIGSEMSGGVKDIYVNNCSFMGTEIGLRFKSARGRGGVVENIFISNIFMTKIPETAIHFTTYYEGRAPMEDDQAIASNTAEVTEETPIFRNITISDIICENANTGITISGLDEMYIKNIVFNNMKIKSKAGVGLYNADSIRFKNLNLTVGYFPAIYLDNTTNIEFDGFTIQGGKEDSLICISGQKSYNIQFDNRYNNEKAIIKKGSIKNKKVVIFNK